MELITKYGELNKLRVKTEALSLTQMFEKESELLDVKNKLYEYLENEENAIGISAPQLGIYLPIFALKINGKLENFVCPHLTEYKNPFYSREGCMSFPGIQCYAIRFDKIMTDSYHFNHQNILKRNPKSFSKLYSAAFQHEFDHLLGFNIVDRAAPLTTDQAQEIDINKIIRVFRDENKRDYFLEDENIYFYSGESVPEFIEEEKDGEIIKSPLKSTFIGFKIKDNINEENSQSESIGQSK